MNLEGSMSHRHLSLVRRLAHVAALLLLTAAAEYAHPSWNVKTHVYAANLALADVVDNGKVWIPPFGEFAVDPVLVQALRKHPDDYRAGVVGPDAFPDIYVGQSYAHVDHWCDDNAWIADDWIRQVFDAAYPRLRLPRSTPLGSTTRTGLPANLSDLQLRHLAFAYGYLTHGAQDMFGHTFINHYVGAKWGGFTGADSVKVDARHIALEAYVARHTPRWSASNDSSISVDDAFQAEFLIKAPAIRRHVDAIHYRRFLATYDWLGNSIARTDARLNHDHSDVNCVAHFPDCMWYDYMVGWRKDIDRGLRHLVDANAGLGTALLAGQVSDGVGDLTDWSSVWLPKMFGAHAVGELDAQMIAFGDWWATVNPMAPVDSIINKAIWDEVDNFLRHNLGPEYQLFDLIRNDPAIAVNALFPPESLAHAKADMHMAPAGDSIVAWLDFAALYNTVEASKLVLLDAHALNDLATRAGMAGPLYPDANGVNVMIGVMRSMDGDHQWDSTNVDPTSGEARASYGLPFRRPAPVKSTVATTSSAAGRRPVAQAGRPGSIASACAHVIRPAPELGDTATGYALWGAPEAQQKIFQRIFKGWGGPGPGPAPAGMPGVPITVSIPSSRLTALSMIAPGVDSVQLAARELQAAVGRAPALAPAQLARFSKNPRALRFSWGRASFTPRVQELRSAMAELESALLDGGREAPAQRQRLNVMRSELLAIDASAERVLTAADRPAAQAAASDIAARADALARMR